MAYPKAYEPQEGYQFQILCRHPEYNGREWESCDYATDRGDLKHLMENYRQCYIGYEFKTIELPIKYQDKDKIAEYNRQRKLLKSVL